MSPSPTRCQWREKKRHSGASTAPNEPVASRVARWLVAIYHIQMSRIKTTVYLRATDYGRLKSIADAENRSAAELIREAVGEYTTRKVRALLPRSIGMGDSGMPHLAERYEDYLHGFGEDTPVGDGLEADGEPGAPDGRTGQHGDRA